MDIQLNYRNQWTNRNSILFTNVKPALRTNSNLDLGCCCSGNLYDNDSTRVLRNNAISVWFSVLVLRHCLFSKKNKIITYHVHI